MLSSDVGSDKSEPRSRKLSLSDAGGIRDRTTAKEPVVRRRKKATRVRGPREEHTQQQGQIKRTERAQPTAGEKSIEDLEEDWKGSKSDTVKELVAKSKRETKAEAESEIDTQTFPR